MSHSLPLCARQMKKKVKRLPENFRFGSTPLYHFYSTGEKPEADGVRRTTENCIELETFSNSNKAGAAHFIGLSIIVTTLTILLGMSAIGFEKITRETTITAFLIALFPPMIGGAFYFLSGNHRCRGSFIRIHRGTRKVYYIFPGQKELHILDWDQLEALAGYIPIISGSINTSRHPLYLVGIDHAMKPPTEICLCCGNLGIYDGDRSAKSLWSYLQHFMANGPDGLPEPPPLPARMTRKQATLRHFQEWKSALNNSLSSRRGKRWAPIRLPVRVFWLFWHIFPQCLAEFIQYNVPYTQFPREIDELCGFVQKRKTIIRVNGKRVDG
ncbi:hypothetical protein G3436_18580 [Pseudomonas sp. MAFF212427]|uniref:DUF6708 domain-containing protein n=2 Tax=Pseudomonas brassicae TaxID=2708063 RepID=A0A6B3P180_9PSED|nr:hypothetical protein [Pseudomonas brassicae]